MAEGKCEKMDWHTLCGGKRKVDVIALSGMATLLRVNLGLCREQCDICAKCIYPLKVGKTIGEQFI